VDLVLVVIVAAGLAILLLYRLIAPGNQASGDTQIGGAATTQGSGGPRQSWDFSPAAELEKMAASGAMDSLWLNKIRADWHGYPLGEASENDREDWLDHVLARWAESTRILHSSSWSDQRCRAFMRFAKLTLRGGKTLRDVPTLLEGAWVPAEESVCIELPAGYPATERLLRQFSQALRGRKGSGGSDC
jgi:hypothetical protein